MAHWGLAEPRRIEPHTVFAWHRTCREEELGMVLHRWEQACDGEGQVVAVCGEPGIGKSRIVHELQSRLSDTAHQTVRYQCSPYHTNAPLHPFTEQLERMAGLDRDDAPEAKCDKLEAVIAAAGKQATVVMPLLAAVLSLDTGSRYPALNLSAQKQKEEHWRHCASLRWSGRGPAG